MVSNPFRKFTRTALTVLLGHLLAFVPAVHAQTCTPTPTTTLTPTSADLQAYWIDATTIPVTSFNTSYIYTLWYAPNAGISETVGMPFVTPTGNGVGSVPLQDNKAITQTQLGQYPQLVGYEDLTWQNATPSAAQLQTILQSQIKIIGTQMINGVVTVEYYTGVQDAGVLDTLYAYSGVLGPVYKGSGTNGIQVSVWAPTATQITLNVYQNWNDANTSPIATATMMENAGVWIASVSGADQKLYYLFNISVYDPKAQAIVHNYATDPYSLDIAKNGGKSRFTNLDDASTQPTLPNGTGWANDQAPALSSISDLSIYELHVRDFSSYSGIPGATADPNLPAAHIGTYLAFTDSNSYGMTHLATLASAGLKAVHLLPTNHFASSVESSYTYNLNEDSSVWQVPSGYANFPMDSPYGCVQETNVIATQFEDNYDWGYVPVHYMAPEGAYATAPDNRVLEYREMVMGLHQAGLRVIQDVVFHKSTGPYMNVHGMPITIPLVLDQIVPAYYYRLDTTGLYTPGASCCETATEHKMMEKLMIDTVKLMATEYHIDGFRFDIMSAIPFSAMQDLQAAVANLTLGKGVASQIYLYGEGFQTSQVPGSPSTNANIQNLAGTGIGAFNDRGKTGDVAPETQRDQNGNPAPTSCEWDTNSICFQQQAFATGLFTDNNAETNSYHPTLGDEAQLLQYTDFVRASLTGNLAAFQFQDFLGATVAESQMPYPFDSYNHLGYTNDPTEAVNEPGDHDGLLLFDSVQVKSAAADNINQRTRRHILALSVMELGQGIPFFVAGEDGLHSRGMDDSSGNSGDWFNNIDWSFQTDNWAIGLPRENSMNTNRWPYIQAVIQNSSSTPGVSNIQMSVNVFQDFLKIRESSGLFHMAVGPFGCNPGFPINNPNYCTNTPNNPNQGSTVISANAQTIISNLHFLNTGTASQVQVPGLIVMKIDNNTGGTYSGSYSHIVVAFNASLARVTFTDPALANLPTMALHPIQQHGSDPVVLSSRFTSTSNSGTLVIPPLTTAVFVQ